MVNKKKILNIETILDENTRIETIRDKETLKNILRKVIDSTLYRKVKGNDIQTIVEEIYQEYNIMKIGD